VTGTNADCTGNPLAVYADEEVVFEIQVDSDWSVRLSRHCQLNATPDRFNKPEIFTHENDKIVSLPVRFFQFVASRFVESVTNGRIHALPRGQQFTHLSCIEIRICPPTV
jgi:hypothetical protein